MNDPLQIAICEDSKTEKDKLLEIINCSQFQTNCTVFSCGEDFLSDFVPNKYDLILMDIYMEGMSGIETVEKIREIDTHVPVAFITTSLDHTLESYRLSALRYIEKPYKGDDINDILELAIAQRNNSPSLIIKKGHLYEKLRLSRIVYLEQNARQIIIHMDDHTMVETYDKLTGLLSQLEGQDFFHCHKSYVINLRHVAFLDQELKCYIMSDGSNVPIRRESFFKAKHYFEEFLFDFSKED